MSSKPDRTPTSVQAAAAVSLVALVACALASDARASRLPVEPGVADGELSARVGTIIKRVRAGEPTLLPQLPPEQLSARVGTIIKRVRAGEPTLLPQLPPEPKMAWPN